jgi:hypothetical protein
MDTHSSCDRRRSAVVRWQQGSMDTHFPATVGRSYFVRTRKHGHTLSCDRRQFVFCSVIRTCVSTVVHDAREPPRWRRVKEAWTHTFLRPSAVRPLFGNKKSVCPRMFASTDVRTRMFACVRGCRTDPSTDVRTRMFACVRGCRTDVVPVPAGWRSDVRFAFGSRRCVSMIDLGAACPCRRCQLDAPGSPAPSGTWRPSGIMDTHVSRPFGPSFARSATLRRTVPTAVAAVR